MNLDEIKNLHYALSLIPDPRFKRGIRYKLNDILLIMIYAILAGYGHPVEIYDYIDLNFDYFNKLIGLKKVPSHDTFARILAILDTDYLSRVLDDWLKENFPEIYTKYNDRYVLHIDGKCVKAAARKSEGESSVYLLNAMYEGGTISLYTKKVGDKENEITTLPELIKMFNLKDTIITIDAIACNNTSVKQILDEQAHFVLPVKGNQKTLHNAIIAEVDRLCSENEFDKLETYIRSSKKKHGREETYIARMIKDLKFLSKVDFSKAKKDNEFSLIEYIGRIVIIDKKTIKKEKGELKETNNRSYIITDMCDMNVETILNIKLSHWQIETQHWYLDVQLDEDNFTIRRGNSVVNASMLKRFCMAIKKRSEYSSDTLRRFFIRNNHSVENITKILFNLE